jgi:putative transcriptional regulator
LPAVISTSHIFVNMVRKRSIYLKCFGEHVRKLRKKKKLAQVDLASIMDKDRQSIQRVEAGNINPSILYLIELAEGLQMPLRDLVDFRLPDKRRR